MSALRATIDDAVKRAMKGGDRERVARLRLITAAIKQLEVDERRELGDADIITVLERMAKQRREALQQFEAAGREELAARERSELALIGEYLPAPLSDAEVEALIDEAIRTTGASSVKDMGRVMATLKPQAQGRVAMDTLSTRVKARLTSGD